jgi:hypothetical protein
LLPNWRNLLPLAGFGVAALTGVYFLLSKKPEDPGELERERRSYLNRVGRIVEGYIVEISDQQRASGGDSADSTGENAVTAAAAPFSNGAQKLLYYSYSISGVTYETAQDITGLEARAHISRVAAGQTASVKYDPSNPSNSILVADDWSGLH